MGELELLPVGDLPVFKGESWDEHVETWRGLEDRLNEHRWQMAAIAASLTARWGEKGEVLARFAHEVGASARRVYEYAATYKAFQSRERSQILSFHHHTIAARAGEPEAAIERAEVEELSTRELAAAIKEEDKEATVIPVETMVCPRCDGEGVVPAE